MRPSSRAFGQWTNGLESPSLASVTERYSRVDIECVVAGVHEVAYNFTERKSPALSFLLGMRKLFAPLYPCLFLCAISTALFSSAVAEENVCHSLSPSLSLTHSCKSFRGKLIQAPIYVQSTSKSSPFPSFLAAVLLLNKSLLFNIRQMSNGTS